MRHLERKEFAKKDIIDLDTLRIGIQLQEMPWLICDKQSLTILDKNNSKRLYKYIM